MMNIDICTLILFAAVIVCLASAFFAVRIICVPQLPSRKKIILAAAYIVTFGCISWSITNQLLTEDGSVFAAFVACITLGCSGLILTSVRYTFRSLMQADEEKSNK